jgi:putative tricarboxylic transport membrane protein
MITGDGNLLVFFSNPLVGTITTLAIVMLLWPLITSAIAALRGPPNVAGVAKGE